MKRKVLGGNDMLDFTKISFNELDTDEPLQAFYNYDLKESEN